MINAAMFLGIFLLLAGMLAFLLPANLWRGVTAQGSRWRNKTSTARLPAFAGLGWVGLILLLAYSAMVMEARLTQYALGVSLPVFIGPSDGVKSALMSSIATGVGIYGALSLAVVPNDARHTRRILK